MKLLLLDSLSLLNRAYYALPPLTTSDGKPINAVFGYFKMLTKLIKEQKPTHIVAAFDVHAPTFRKQMYEEYKANRKPAPEDLIVQIELMKDLFKAMNVAIVEKAGYEADDILGTLAKASPMDTIIVTGDRDSLQLVSNKTHVFMTKVGVSNIVEYTPQVLAEEGLSAHGIIELKAMMGDSSDNIPGIKGVGEKTAKHWLAQYQTIDELYAHADEIKGKIGEKVRESKDIAFLSRTLATINCDVPLDINFDNYVFKYPFEQKAKQKMIEYNFTSALSTLDFIEDENAPISKKVEVLEWTDAEEIQKNLAGLLKNDAIAVCFDDNEVTIATSSEQCILIKCENNFLSPLYLNSTLSLLAPIFEKSKLLVLFDSKGDRRRLKSEFDIEIKAEVFDVSLALYVKSNVNSFDTVKDFALSKGATDCFAARIIEEYQSLLTEFENNERMRELYYTVELPLSSVLYEMEINGFTVDASVLKSLSNEYNLELNALTDAICDLAGERFNVNSTKQLSEILFEKLGLKSGKKTKTGYSSSVEVLEEIKGDHPIIPMILRYRQLSKLNGTYCVGLQSAIMRDGKIRTTFRQNLTNTGRLSSVDPNLQNIPVRTQEGREIRKAFLPSLGNVLISADYSQIELRLLAHFSGDENLIGAFKAGKDIHRFTASLTNGVPEEMVTAEMRRASKAVNFGIIYGMSDFGLSTEIGVSVFTARKFIENYFQMYPLVKTFMDASVKFAKENGYVETLFGRRREIPELKSPKYTIRQFGERIAKNMPLQGTAADIIKIATIKVNEALKKELPQAKLIMQIHDELIVDCPKDKCDQAITILKREMENCVTLSVPLTVETGVGENWYDAK